MTTAELPLVLAGRHLPCLCVGTSHIHCIMIIQCLLLDLWIHKSTGRQPTQQGHAGRNYTRVALGYLTCSKIAEAEAAVSVNEKKWLVMHMQLQLQLDELRGPQTKGYLTCGSTIQTVP